MTFDNRLFNVNGKSKKLLKSAIKLAFKLESHNENGATAQGYVVDSKKGILLLWHADGIKGAVNFEKPKGYRESCDFIIDWLKTPEAQSIELNDWEADIDHDGSSDLGWRVYLEDWGHVGNNHYAICAVKPCYIWYGK